LSYLPKGKKEEAMLLVVPHVRQSNAQDCGVTCVAMVVRGLGLRIPAQGAALWTIHLAYMLKHCGAQDFTFYTRCCILNSSYIGVNYSHKKQTFYNKITEDCKEVHQLFRNAREHHIRIVPLSIKN
jgi:hypothetical protein